MKASNVPRAGMHGCICAPGYATGYVVQRAAALFSQVRDLDATCDSDPISRILFSTVPPRSTHRFLRVSASSIRTALIRRPCPQGKTEVAAGGPAGVGRQQPLHFAPDCQAVLGTPRPKERAQWNAPRAVILMPSSSRLAA